MDPDQNPDPDPDPDPDSDLKRAHFPHPFHPTVFLTLTLNLSPVLVNYVGTGTEKITHNKLFLKILGELLEV